jgi:deoxycytidylate deaminase
MEEKIIRDVYNKCLENREKYSTCNKRKVGAAIILPEIVLPDHKIPVYYGVNGDLKDPCNKRGEDYCKREYGDAGMELQYFTCPSLCAEGSAILKAIIDERIIKNGIIVSTAFPCKRCTSMIIDKGISELYFDEMKHNEVTEAMLYIGWMVNRHISVNQITPKKIFNYNHLELFHSHMFALSGTAQSSFYLDSMFDPKARKERAKFLRQLDKESQI